MMSSWFVVVQHDVPQGARPSTIPNEMRLTHCIHAVYKLCARPVPSLWPSQACISNVPCVQCGTVYLASNLMPRNRESYTAWSKRCSWRVFSTIMHNIIRSVHQGFLFLRRANPEVVPTRWVLTVCVRPCAKLV
jgi:hypothetical protein